MQGDDDDATEMPAASYAEAHRWFLLSAGTAGQALYSMPYVLR